MQKTTVGVGLGVVLVAVATQAGALPPPPNLNPPPPPPVQDQASRIAAFFRDAAKKTRDEASAELAELRAKVSRAEEAGRKTARDFADGCPSNAAQSLYDDLGRTRAAIDSRRNEIRAANEVARRGLQACMLSFPPPPNGPGPTASPCWAAYQGSFGGWSDLETQANNTIAAIDAARTALRAIRCPACTSNGAYVNYPLVRVDAPGTFTGPTPPGGIAVRPGRVDVQVAVPTGEVRACTQWDPGRASLSVSAREGELDQSASLRLPRCAREEVVSQRCEAVNVAVLLPKLRELSLLPAKLEIDPGRVTVSIPRRQIQVPIKLRKATCRNEPQVCTRVAGSGSISFDSGDPLGSLTQASASCVERRPLSGLCTDPPFGVEVEYQAIDIPDPERAELVIEGPGVKVSPTRIKIDLTRPDLKVSCTRLNALSLPAIPKVNVQVASLYVPQICRQTEMRPLVSRP